MSEDHVPDLQPNSTSLLLLLLERSPSPLDGQVPLDFKVSDHISHPHQYSACAQGDEDTDHHYHSHGDWPLIEVVPARTVYSVTRLKGERSDNG